MLYNTMLTTVPTPATSQKTETSALNRLIMNPGGSMPFDKFCDKWLPWLYRGIEKNKKTSQQVTCFRTGEKLTLTWKQAWLREIGAWDISPSAALHWDFEGKNAPYFVKRFAYMMDLILEINLILEEKREFFSEKRESRRQNVQIHFSRRG